MNPHLHEPRAPKQAPLGELAATGIAGLDELLLGGFPRNRLYLVQGEPGVGKTTLALQFLLEGVKRGERVLYITLSETRDELHAVAESHGWSLEGVDMYDSRAIEGVPLSSEEQSIFHSSEVELTATVSQLQKVVDEIQPVRIVVDSLSELRLLAADPLRFRRQILALKLYFSGKHCTTLLIEDNGQDAHDMQLRSIVHGVLQLERLDNEYGGIRRRLHIVKLRGVAFREGHHDYAIRTGGIVVYPRLVVTARREIHPLELVSSGLPALDELLGGGLPRGFSALLIGPAGIGKSTIAMQYVLAAADRGERCAIFLFDERPETVAFNVVGRKLVPHWESGRVLVRQVDPSELSPGEFAHDVRRVVCEENVRVVLIDGLDGFLQAMPQEKHLLLHLHELTTFLGQRRVTTLMTKVQHGMMSRDAMTGVDLTYISDAALLFRYFEFEGEIRQAVSVFKKRGGHHERTIREMRVTSDGPWIGAPLDQFRGVLTGVPEFQGKKLPKEKP